VAVALSPLSRSMKLKPRKKSRGTCQPVVRRTASAPIRSAIRPRTALVESTLARWRVPAGSRARQSVKVPPVSIQMRQGVPSGALLTDDLDQHPLGAAAVELAVEDLLPGTEVEAAAGDGDHHRLSERRAAGGPERRSPSSRTRWLSRSRASARRSHLRASTSSPEARATRPRAA